MPAIQTRLTIFDLDTLAPVGEIAAVGGNGAAVDPKSGHGFTSSKPVSMFDTKTMKLIKTIDVGEATRPDGIYFDPFNQRGLRFQSPDEGRDGEGRRKSPPQCPRSRISDFRHARPPNGIWET
jgi:hypothetical protein